MNDDTILAAGAVLLLIVFGIGAAIWNSEKCHQRAEAMNVEYRWGIFTGCMIKHGGAFVPLENYREVSQ